MNETYIMQKILGTLIILLLAGCAGDSLIDRQLALAELLMDEKPNSVLAMLEAMDINDLETDRQKAIYVANLYQAKYKNYIFESDDSLISIATDYFSPEEDPRYYMFAHIQKAHAYFWAAEYPKVVDAALKALEVAPIVNDDILSAKSYDVIADAYYEAINMDVSIKYREKALAHYRKTDRVLNQMFAYVEIARSYANWKDYEKAVSLLDSVPELFPECDSLTMAFYYSSYHRPLLHLKQYDRALEFFHKTEDYLGGKYHPMINYATIAEIFAEKGDADSVEYYLKKFEQNSSDYNKSGEYHYSKAQLYKLKKNYVAAAEELELRVELYDEIFWEYLNQNVAFTDRNFHHHKLELEKLKTEKQDNTIAFLLTFLLLLVVAFTIYYIYSVKRKRLMMERQMFEAQELKSRLLDSQNKIANLSDALRSKENSLLRQDELIERLFSEHFAVLDNLSCEYFSKRDSDSAQVRQTIIKDFEREIAKIKHPDQIRKIEAIVNDCRDNIITRLRAQFPKFKEADITYLTLVLANFSPKAVCLLCDITIGNYYNKWTRLRARIADSAAPDREFFINTITPPPIKRCKSDC